MTTFIDDDGERVAIIDDGTTVQKVVSVTIVSIINGISNRNVSEPSLSEFELGSPVFRAIRTEIKTVFDIGWPSEQDTRLHDATLRFVTQKLKEQHPAQEEETIANEAPDGSFETWLVEQRIDLFGSWSGGENTLELSYQNDEKNVALVSWTSNQGKVISLVGGNRKVTIPNNPPQSNVSRRLVADGYYFNKTGKKEEMKVLAEFEFDPANQTEITKFCLRICPTSKEDVPVHTYALIEVDPAKPKSATAKLCDQDDQQLGAVMKKKK